MCVLWEFMNHQKKSDKIYSGKYKKYFSFPIFHIFSEIYNIKNLIIFSFILIFFYFIFSSKNLSRWLKISISLVSGLMLCFYVAGMYGQDNIFPPNTDSQFNNSFTEMRSRLFSILPENENTKEAMRLLSLAYNRKTQNQLDESAEFIHSALPFFQKEKDTIGEALR